MESIPGYRIHKKTSSVDKSIEIIQWKEKRQKSLTRSSRILQEYTKRSNIRVIRVPQEEKEEHMLKNRFEKIMAVSFETW